MKNSSKNNKNSYISSGADSKQNKNLSYGKSKTAGRKLEAKAIVMIVVSAILAITLLVGVVLIFFNHAKEEEERDFDYLTSDLSKYITISSDKYKNYTVDLKIAKPKAIDVDVTLLNLLKSKKGPAINNAVAQFSGKIEAGDIVNIYYRGYTLDENGKEVYVDNVCNFGNKNASGVYTYASLEIGSNQFVPGFELGLAGKEFSSQNNFVRITSGAVKEGQIVYITYTRQLDGSTASNDKITRSAERIVIADGKEKIDAKYGVGFYDMLMGLNVGSAETTTFSGVVDGKKYNYKDIKIDFATECEKEGTYFLVECYFPYDYGFANLNNKTVYFEVYVQSMADYESKTLTNEFIEENLTDKDFGVTAEDLEEFEGDRISQLRQYIQKLLDEDYEELLREKIEEAMWNHYHSEGVAAVSKYPQIKVDAIYNEYFDDVLYQFEQSGGVITNVLGESKTCESVEDYAIIYLGLEYAENKDWRDVLRKMSENLVKERLILFYIMRNENIMPTAEELAAKKKEVEDEYLEEYIYQYSEQYSVDKSTYSDEKWAEFKAERYKELHDYYDDAYFTEITYYEIGLDAFLAWPTVTTFDGKIQ